MDATRETTHLAPERPETVVAGADHPAMGLASNVLCFRHGLPGALSAGAFTPVRLNVIGLTCGLSQFSEAERAAFGRLLPILLCGEESAFQVFWREGRRISDNQFSRSQALAYRIAAEELQHEQLLQGLRNYCPVPDDISGTLAQSRQFFMRMRSRDPAVHFAMVAALDSTVCIILSALAKPFSRVTAVVEILNRIRSDEARHVRFSRQHAYELGAIRSTLADTAVQVRSEVATLLCPLGGAFEDLGVDMNHLFRTVNAHEWLA